MPKVTARSIINDFTINEFFQSQIEIKYVCECGGPVVLYSDVTPKQLPKCFKCSYENHGMFEAVNLKRPPKKITRKEAMKDQSLLL